MVMVKETCVMTIEMEIESKTTKISVRTLAIRRKATSILMESAMHAILTSMEMASKMRWMRVLEFQIPDQNDLDADGTADACDDDIDGDGLTQDQEAALGAHPFYWDSDADGIADDVDTCPIHLD